jgi:glycosyltransferase involved in cell wall biosynthesis
MKVLHLIDSGGLYGAEQMLLALAEEQIKQGLEPIILSCGLPNEPDKPLEIEAEKRGISVKRWRMKAGLNFKGAWRILQMAHTEHVDILHSHGYKFNILLAAFPKFIRKIPVVSTVHGYVKAKVFSKMWLYEIMDRLALKNINYVVAVSNAMAKYEPFSSRNNNGFKVIQNGISKTPIKVKNFNVRENTLLNIMAVGRLSPEKGFDYLINALFELKTMNVNVHLTIFGDGGLKYSLEKLADSLGLSSQVVFAGFNSNIPARMHDFDLLVMPSLTEGIPITLLEALREKIAVCASNVGGIPEVLGEDSPYLIEPADVNSITKSLREFLLLSSDEIKQLILDNFYKFEDGFTSVKMQEKYTSVYFSLVNGKS